MVGVRNGEERTVFQELIEELEHNQDPQIRCSAADALGTIGNAEAIPCLIGALSDGEKAVRAHVAAALGKLGSAAVEPLRVPLADANWIVRYRAAEALGLIGDAEAVRPLVRALRDDVDHVRYMSAKALAHIRDPQALEPLIATLGDENEFVRRSVAAALGAMPTDAARSALEEALRRECCEGVRTAVADALARGWPSGD
jgi:HEAT repeat protein